MSLTHQRAIALFALLCLTVSPFGSAAPPLPVEDPTGLAGPTLAGAVVAAESAVAEAEQRLAEVQALAEQAVKDAQEVAQAQIAEAEHQVVEAQALAEEAADDAQGLALEQVEAAEQELADAQALAAMTVADAQQQAEQQVAEALLALAEAQAELERLAVQAACEDYRVAMARSDVEVWTTCNMGPDSGLDADLLDGMSSETILARIDTETLARITGDDALAARLDSLDLDIDGRAWAAVLARDGAASTLDADRLDGLDSARFVQYTPDGRVGIGTASPDALLGVNGRIRAEGIHGPASGDLILAGYDSGTGTGRGIDFNAVDGGYDFQTYQGGWKTRMYIADGGNVGIGTAGPGSKLDVRYDSGAGVRVGTTASPIGSFDWTTGKALLYGLSGYGLGLGADNEEHLTIDTAGNVGIGTATPSPGVSLHVRDATPGSPGRSAVQVEATGENAYYTLVADAAGPTAWERGALLVKLGPNQGAGPAGTLKLNNIPDSSQNHLVIAPGGNVGVGTGTPRSTLEVGGYVQLARTGGAPPAGDCDAASERGRMKVDAAAGLLYVCMDSGWVGK